ncbi:hypothetical protein [Sphingobacterium sp. BN32]|uniref:hypothetical protein n=1 Tax=Sphingobacterium sp. BN32 TaxID=3058432 RepID=UPI00265CA78B|nr:hypothetical protein [Sphingobacterium sp. BN32]WKK58298.1 hypothetical protein QYC40_16835 [Sphingobacterium sp. BN32]
MTRMALIHYFKQDEFSEQPFDEIAEELAGVFRNTDGINTYRYLGIDPHPQSDGTVRVYFEYEIEITDQA